MKKCCPKTNKWLAFLFIIVNATSGVVDTNSLVKTYKIYSYFCEILAGFYIDKFIFVFNIKSSSCFACECVDVVTSARVLT